MLTHTPERAVFAAFLVLVAVVVLPNRAALGQGHAASSTLSSYVRASEVIDRAVAAHGGPQALKVVQQLHVRIEGFDYHRNQGRRVAAPYDSTPRIIELFTDLPLGRLVNQQTTGYPGGFVYSSRNVSDSARHFYIDVRNRTFAPRQYPPAAQQAGNLFQVPQGYLTSALESPVGTRRYLGRMKLASGAEVEAVTFFVPNTTLTLGFDPTTHLLRSIMSVGTDPFTGDTEVDTEFLEYRPLGGVLLPTRALLIRGGERIRELRYVNAATGQPVPDSLLSPPASFTQVAEVPPSDPVRTLAPGVWAIRGGGSWSLLADVGDHLVAVDASPNGAPEVIARSSTLAPGKAIRFVAPTHHHDDHFAGVRAYAASGATTVTTPGNAEYFRRIVRAPATTLSANQPAPQPAARLELLQGKMRTFGSGAQALEIHEIGPNAHATEMLIAWVPSAGVLFHGDLIEAPASGLAQPGANSETTMQLAEFIKRKGWHVKVFAGVHGFLASPEEFDKLVRFPAPVTPDQ